MLVHTRRVKTKHREFIYKTKCFYYNPSNSKKTRAVRMCKTGEGKKKRNEHKSYLGIKHKAYENFDIGDWWVTFTHKTPTEPEEAKKILANVLSKTRKKLKRKDIPFVWYSTTEASERTPAHHHLLIRNTSPEIISIIFDYWKEYGIVKEAKPIYNMSNGKLVKYFLDGDHKGMTYKTFSHSRNLREPEEIIRVLPMASVRENPKPPKCEEYGYKYEVDKTTVFNFDNGLDGFTYQEYEIFKVKDTDIDEADTAKPHRRK